MENMSLKNIVQNISFKTIFKNINFDTLLFDILLLLIANTITILAVNNNYLSFTEETNMYPISIIMGFLLFVLFISIGEIIGRYKKYGKPLAWWLIALILFLTSFSLLAISEDIFKERLLFRIFIIVAFVLVIAGFLLGYFSRIKGIEKSIKSTSVVTFIVSLVMLVFVISIAWFNGEDVLDPAYLLLFSSIFVGIIVLFGVLPPRIARLIQKSDGFKKVLIYVFVVLSAVTFSFWDIITQNNCTITDSLGMSHKSGIYPLAYLPLLTYRFLFALSPPKNKTNMIIGAVVLIIVILY